MKIGLVAPSDAGLVWPLVGPLLDKAMEYAGGRYDLQSLFEKVQSGAQHLWIVAEEPRHPIAAFTTQVLEYPLGKFLSCQFCGGENRMDEWIVKVDDILVRFARDAGCVDAAGNVNIEMTGRSGWARKLPPSWREEARLYRRSVSDGQGLSTGRRADNHDG